MSFYTDVLKHDPRFNSPNACYDPALLEPSFRRVIEQIIVAGETAGHRLRIGETFRSAARQQYLYKKGLTQFDGLTPANIGVHHFGLACDLVLLDADGHYDGEGGHYAFLVGLAASHPCPWGPTISGIDWGEPNRPHSFRDWDHLQAVTLVQEPALFAGTWFPAARASQFPAFVDTDAAV